MKIVLLLVCVAFVWADLIEGNFIIRLENITNSTFDLEVYTRSRFGRSLLNIFNTNPQTGTPFATNMRNGIWKVERMKPNSTLFSENFDLVNDGLTRNMSDANIYPLGYFGNDVVTLIRFDRTIFEQKFGPNFNLSVISIGRHTFDSPRSVDFTIRTQLSLINNTQLEVPKSNVSRYEHVSITFFLITFAWYLLSLILCIIFFDKQPLKSRGVIPYLAIWAFTFSLCYSGSTFIFDFGQLRSTACIWKAFLEFPSMFTCIFISYANFLRYVVLINLNKYKISQLKLKNPDEDTAPPTVAPTKLILLFKIMSHWAFSLFGIIIIYLFWTLFFGLSLAIMKFKCEARDFLYWFNAYAYIGVGLLGIPIILFDLWMNRDIICSCQWKRFWKEDVFWTRFEIYVLTYIFALGLYCIVRIISLSEGHRLARIIMFSLAYHGLYFAQVAFPILVTVIDWCRAKTRKPVAQNTMLNIMNHSEGYFLLLEFAKNEYSSENITCWDDIQKYKAENDQNRKRKLAMSIYSVYMTSNSPSEINLAQNIIRTVKERLDTGIPTKTLFHECESQLLVNITDTFSRFAITTDYYSFAQREKFILNSLGNN